MCSSLHLLVLFHDKNRVGSATQNHRFLDREVLIRPFGWRRWRAALLWLAHLLLVVVLLMFGVGFVFHIVPFNLDSEVSFAGPMP